MFYGNYVCVGFMAFKQTVHFKIYRSSFGYFGIINQIDICTLFEK